MSILENLRQRGKGRSAGCPVRRHGGARRRLRPIEVLEPRIVLANWVVPGTLGADLILVQRDPSNAAFIQVKVNGTTLLNDQVGAGDTYTINALGGNDIINVEDTFAGATLTINGGDHNDTINVTSVARNLDEIDGSITVDGGDGTDTLNVHDQNNAFARTYTVTNASVGRNASATIGYGSIDRLNLNGGGPSETYKVESTAVGVTTAIAGSVAGNDSFQVTPTARHFGSIAGNLAVYGGGGLNGLTISDQLTLATLGNTTYTVTGSTVAKNASATVSYDSMTSGVTLHGALGNSTFNVESTAPNTPVSIYGNSLNDAANVSPGARNLNNIRGNLAFIGGGGVNNLVVNDQNNANPDTFTLTGTSVGRTNSARIGYDPFGWNWTVHAGAGNNTVNVTGILPSGSLAFNGGGGTDALVGSNAANTFEITGLNAGRLGLLGFSSFENIRGNAQVDVFRFGASGALSGTVDGDGGVDRIDYSARALPVSVNLLAGTATSTVGVSRIENVTGGAGNDTMFGNGIANVLVGNGGHDLLVGDGGNDTISGGGGRDLVIGGTGSDTLTGDGEDDILIGGRTSYDANLAALQAIRNEWTSANSYTTRLNNLRAGTGLNGAYVLVSSGPGQTVFDDGVLDTLAGNLGLDWFFTATPDPFPSLSAGEQIN